jgi:hypothetical protein
MKEKYKNIKNGTIYEIVQTEIINCTNAQDGQKMILYTNGELTFCREEQEFYKKFEKISE